VSAPPLIDTRAGFHQALAWGFESAIARGARRIVCCDPDFTAWSWDDNTTLDRLGAWLRLPQRQLVLLAQHFEAVPRHHPRFNRWRADWAHAITGRQAVDVGLPELPSVLVADRAISVQLIDPVHWRGRAADDEPTAHRWRLGIDAVLQRSEPALAVRTLGL
jgi:hypothetical protein